MDRRIKRIVAYILSFAMMLLTPFSSSFVTETKADNYSCKLYFKLPDGTQSSDWGFNNWGDGVVATGGNGTVVVVPWGNQEFPALEDEGNGFGSITLTATGEIQGVQFVKADGTGYTGGVWNTKIQAQDLAEAYFNTADSKWYKESTFTTEILAPTLDDIYYVVGTDTMIGEGWMWNTDKGLMSEVSEGVYSVTFSEIPDGTYEFKILQDPKDFGWDYMIVDYALILETGNMGVIADQGVNDITITLDVTAMTVTVSVIKSDEPEDEPVVPVEPEEVWQYDFLEDGTVKIIGYSGEVSSLVIPSQIAGNTVTAVGSEAFYNNKFISSVEIPANITSIEYGAFAGCEGLTSIKVDENNKVYDSRDNCNAIIDTNNNVLVTGCKNTIIPYGIIAIGDSAFLGCTGLTTIEIPTSVTSIGERGFECSGLTSIVIPSSVTDIGAIAFDACKNLTSVEIPSSVTYIRMATFSYCEKLTSVKLPSGLKGIGEYAFESCTSLTNIEFPSSLTDIQWYSFSGCTSLASIKIPAEVKSLGGWAFAGCTSLTSIKLPASMSGIGYATFMGCTGLTKIELPSSLTYMDYHAFSGCSNLTSIKIPANVSYIEVYAFENCDSLSSIIVDENNTVYDSRNGCNAIIETESNTLIQGCKNTKIPKGIVTVKEAAFQGCTGLTSIEIPEGVKNIEDSAFSGCTSLTNISMPRGVTNIGFHAFSHCESLKNIELLDGIEKIDSYAFYCCYNLESIMLPESLTSIGENAFENCSDLVIFSYENAYAHKYALENGIKWQKIERFDIQETAEVILDKTTYTYDGKAKTPSVTVKVGKNVLVAGKDYTVAYSNNKNVGIAIVTVTGMGNYTGVIKKEFKINPSVVKNFTYSARSSSAVALKWTKNTSAKGYVIEQYKGGKWIAIKTITSNATTSYKATGLSASTACKFRIKAYTTYGSSKLYSSYTTKTVNTLPAGVKNFTYSARSSSAILLKWTKNTSASGYVIEQYKGGKWVAIKTITKNTTTSYKITGLKASTANKFRIKAYKSYGTTKLYSGYVSKTINTLPLGVAGFTYSARTNTTITLKWNKNTSATGYVIEQYKNGKWVKIKTVSKNSTVSYKVSGLKKATSYKFRIKAYKSYGSSKLYSGYVTKTIKTK